MTTALDLVTALPWQVAQRAISVVASPFGARNMPLSWLDRLMDVAMYGRQTAAGVNVTPDSALASTAVYACVSYTAQTLAGLPVHVYRRTPTGKMPAPMHQLEPIVHDLANPEMTAFEYRETKFGHLLTWGNHYSEVETNDAGVKALWPLRPDCMRITRDGNGDLIYVYQMPPGHDPQYVVFGFNQIHHLAGWKRDGVYGLSPIDLAREAVAADIAVADYGARFFSGDARPGGVLTIPGALSKEAKDRLRDAWDARHSGLTGKHRTAVLEAGVTWQSVGVPNENAQFLETRRYGKVDVAAVYHMPPALLGWAESSDIEADERRWRDTTLASLCQRDEQAVYRDLVRISDGRRSHYVKYNMNALARGSLKARYDAYAVGRQNGWFNADDIRAFEDMNPLPDGQGQIYLVPANMVPADMIRAMVAKNLEPTPTPEPVAPAPTPTAGAGGSQPSADGQMNGDK